MARRRSLFVFLAGLLVRLVYIAQIRHTLTFDVPLVDGANYFRLAKAIAAGDLLGGPRVFWQPPLYPYFLAALFSVFGPRMLPVAIVQAALGSLSALLVYRIGRRVFGERAGLCAAIVIVLYGPLVCFDAQPLIPVLHTALVLAGLLLLLRAAGIPGPDVAPPREWGLAGLAWGLAAVATPNILLVVPVAVVWALRELGRRSPATARPMLVPAALLLAGTLTPVALVTARNLAVSGDLVLISSNGGINLYIGNNPGYDRTIRIRPGGEFERLAQEPENLGITKESDKSWYFAERALQFVRQYPGPALRLYLRKTLDLFAGREIPRNENAYDRRRDSSLLALLLWRFGVSFPFGAVAPLAFAGALIPWGSGAAQDGCAADRRRAGRALLLLYAAAYGASILIFFPTDRYRLPLVPVAALFASRVLGSPVADLKRTALVVTLLLGLVLFNLDAFEPGERHPEEEALNRAFALRVKGRPEEARIEYRRALALNPARVDAYNALAVMAAEEGSWEEAARHYETILEIAPDFVEVRHSLGQAYVALGRKDEARREWEIAVNLAPGAGLALADLCLSFRDEGAFAVAEPYCADAVRARPDLAETHFAMGILARATRRTDLARRELEEAARLFPRDSPGRRRAETILRRLLEADGKSAGGAAE